MSDRGGRALRSLLPVSSPAWEKCTQAPRAWSLGSLRAYQRVAQRLSKKTGRSRTESDMEALSFYMPMHTVYPAVLAPTVLLVGLRGCWPCRPYRSKLVSISHASGEIDILPSKKRNLVKNQSKISKVQGTPKLSLGCVTPINAFREGWNLVDIVFGGGPRPCQCQCMGALPEEPPVFCQWGHTTLALLLAVDRVRAVGALPKELPTCTVFASEGTLPWLCSLAEWTESLPWAHCPKSCINFSNEGALPWLALGGGPSPCRGRTARRAVSILPMRAHCPGLLLAVDRVRASGRTARRATCICVRRRWLGRIRETWRPDQATPTSKLSKRWAIDPGGCPQWCWRNPFQPFPKISKKRRTSIFLKLDFRVEHNEKAHERWCMRSLSKKKKKKGLWNAGLEYMDDGNTLLYRARSSDMQLVCMN